MIERVRSAERASWVGWGAVALGFVAWYLTLPPLLLRTPVPSVLVALAAVVAGAIDVLGWQFRIATNDISGSQIGFLGIAVALLGRNTALGVCFSALFFGGLINGTSVRNLDPEIFDPELATNLTLIIQGLIVLLVSAPVIVTSVLALRRRARPGGSAEAEA